MTPQQAIDLLKLHYPDSSFKIGAEVWYYDLRNNTKAEIDLWISPANVRFTGKTVEECVAQAIAAATVPKADSNTTPEDFIAQVQTPEPKEVTCEHSGVTFQTTQPANS